MIELSREEKEVRKAARQFALGEFPRQALTADRTETFDQTLWRQASELGFVGIHLPEEYDGGGFGFSGLCLVTEEFWRVDPGLGQAILSTTFGSEMLLLFGDEDQKRTYLPPLTCGRAVMATAITEPQAGSDVAAVKTRAELEGGQWVVNGSKMFITNGSLATWVLTVCLTDPQAQDPHQRHSIILIPAETPGFTATKLKGKMGIRASDTAELSFKAVRVPEANLIGQRGRGFEQLMAFLNHTRLHIGAQGVGLGQGCLDRSLTQVKGRRQFGRPLAKFQTVQFQLAEMATQLEAARSLVYRASRLVDKGGMDHALVAMDKWYSARMAVEASELAVQLHGGYGYMDETDVQRFYRDAKILEIYEGVREIEKQIIAQALLGGRACSWDVS
ncbi:MAG: acyl-CoA dehydrogenase family protein [Deltaproteobacteria bacterium]|nr:acyl-CoA dehydrogenase family protein [Deltaproteobacteria bacterium]